MATANSLLGLNADPENYVLLTRESRHRVSIQSGFSFDRDDAQEAKETLAAIFDGTIKAVKKRVLRYQ